MHIIDINQREGWKMIMVGHYGRTGAHQSSPSTTGMGQSLMGLTREECSLPYGCAKEQGQRAVV